MLESPFCPLEKVTQRSFEILAQSSQAASLPRREQRNKIKPNLVQLCEASLERGKEAERGRQAEKPPLVRGTAASAAAKGRLSSPPGSDSRIARKVPSAERGSRQGRGRRGPPPAPPARGPGLPAAAAASHSPRSTGEPGRGAAAAAFMELLPGGLPPVASVRGFGEAGGRLTAWLGFKKRKKRRRGEKGRRRGEEAEAEAGGSQPSLEPLLPLIRRQRNSEPGGRATPT